MNPMQVQARHTPTMKRHHAVRGAVALLLLLSGWSGLSQNRPVAAAMVVGGGTSGRALASRAQIRLRSLRPADTVSTCDEATLRAAIANAPAGATLQFGCSGTITLSAGNGPIAITKNLTLDGNGQAVTIDGGNAVGLFTVNTGVAFTVQGLTLANGRNLNGGAIDNEGGTVTVVNSTFSGNAAVYTGGQGIFNGDGGAIYNNNLGTLTVANSTFSGNAATAVGGNGDSGMGGAIFNYGTLSVINSTVSGNSASFHGGGIEIWETAATVANTILANDAGGNCHVFQGTLQDEGGNLEDGASCGFTAASSRSNTNPALAPLANYGGPTLTMALYVGNVSSPAIGLGLPAVCAAPPVNGVDQRGVARGSNACDSGAVEGTVAAPVPVVTSCDESTLRATIANAVPGATVLFGCSGTITLSAANGPITIGKNLTLDGHGQAVTISGGGAVGLFAVNAGMSFTVRGLTLANGSNLSGGAIDNEGTVTVVNSTFSGNAAVYTGQGIFDGDGGAIFNQQGGTLTVANSTFSGNAATGGGGDSGFGGAIFNYGTLSVVNSTFSGNSATGAGGGIETWVGTTTLANTILANDAGGNCDVIQGTLQDGGGNIEDGASCGFTAASSRSNTNPALAPLANYGGPTLTMALYAGSPAIGLGLPPVCAAPPVNGLDQRGVARGSNACDSGAFEGSVGPPPTSTPTPAPVGVSTCDEATLRAAIANAPAGATLQFGCSGTITLSAGNGPIAITKNLTLDGHGQAVTIDGGNAVGLFTVYTGVVFTVQGLTLANGHSYTGGAIENDAGTVIVANSTFSGNAAVADGSPYIGDGGAIFNWQGTVSVANSTFSANAAAPGTGIGGAIFNSSSGSLSVINSTVSGNSATNGGGIANLGKTTLANTILANDAGGNCDVIQGTLQDGGGNIEDGASCGFTAASSRSNTNLLLAPLANNGGPTLTMGLLGGSPAIGLGLPPVCAAPPVNGLDQRGVARGSNACDSGAYEGSVAAPTSTPTNTPTSTPTNTPTSTPTNTPTSTPNARATATALAGCPYPAIAINAGGGAAGSFVADRDFVGASYAYEVSNPIDTSHVTNPAPQAVYQSQRTGSAFSYTIPGLAPGGQYAVRLHFAELYWTAPGQRVFSVAINGQTVLSNLDVYAAAGGRYVALIETELASADGTGTISLSFSANVDQAVVNGIEVLGCAPPPNTPTPTNTATPTNTPVPPTNTATPTSTPTSTSTPTPTNTPVLPTPTNTPIPPANTPVPPPNTPVPPPNTPVPPPNTPVPPANTPVPPTSTARPAGGAAPPRATLPPQAPPAGATPLPLPTATPVAPAVPCLAPSLSLHLSQRSIFGGGRLPFALTTAPGARGTLTLQVTTTTLVWTGKGKHRKRVRQRVVLYTATRQGTADIHGRLTSSVRVAYQPAGAVRAGLTVRTQAACGRAGPSMQTQVTIQPLLILQLARHSVVSGATLPFSLRTAPHAHVSATLRVLAPHVRVTGTGKHRKKTVRTAVLYSVTRSGVASATGQYGGALVVTYHPARAVTATLTVTVRSTDSAESLRVGVTIQPKPHTRR